ncbi:MAG: HD domain-containing protein [Planctomycetota bacterium]
MNSSVVAARAFALAAHGDQRYGDFPYSYHLDAVASILAPYGEEAQIIGLLHDVVEDTDTGLSEIRACFGSRVADCVALVTDVEGPTREARKALTHAKLATVSGDLELALIVKAADRLANLRMSASSQTGGKLDLYRREHAAFRASAHRPGLCDEVWQEIDRIVGGELPASQ